MFFVFAIIGANKIKYQSSIYMKSKISTRNTMRYKMRELRNKNDLYMILRSSCIINGKTCISKYIVDFGLQNDILQLYLFFSSVDGN